MEVVTKEFKEVPEGKYKYRNHTKTMIADMKQKT